MSKLFYCAIGFFLFGKWQHNDFLVHIGYFLFAIWIVVSTIKSVKAAIILCHQYLLETIRKRVNQKQEEIEYKKQLQREIEREQLKSEVQLSAFRKHADLMIEYKKKGLDITKELFEMRKRLLELESNENKNMIQEILQTLNET